tara:strand:- start:431 stop:1234 length:804 start_codon:yes stop_codon:yes gene_type:complete
MASGETLPEGTTRVLNKDLVRGSWAEAQTHLEGESKKYAELREAALQQLYEQTVRTEAANKARDEASEEASRRKAQEDFIELSSDDDEENGDKNDRGDDEKKTNKPNKPIASSVPEIAELAALRREVYAAHLNKQKCASERNVGGRLGGVSGTTGGSTGGKNASDSRQRYGRGSNPLIDPPRYEPAVHPTADDMRLRTDERAEVQDTALCWYGRRSFSESATPAVCPLSAVIMVQHIQHKRTVEARVVHFLLGPQSPIHGTWCHSRR